MLLTETLHHEMHWNRLQEPIHPTQLPQEYLLLLAALDIGWKNAGPVRLLRINEYSGDYAYLFNLEHEKLSQTIQLVVPAAPVVHNYLCEEGLVVMVNEIISSVHCRGLVF
jgi:hypothetical protein